MEHTVLAVTITTVIILLWMFPGELGLDQLTGGQWSPAMLFGGSGEPPPDLAWWQEATFVGLAMGIMGGLYVYSTRLT